jgi:NAD(P)-dependent dehydrogenase (short-subunit alcohol dehydrogenase family)
MNVNSKPLAGRIALITGASRGIGAATALALAQAGAQVIATARNVDSLAPLVEQARADGGNLTARPLEVTDTAALYALAQWLDGEFGRLDVFVANAGLLGTGERIERVAEETWNELFAVNVTANWHLIRALDVLLKRSDAGRALFLTSGLAWRGRPLVGAYAASKAALNALVQAYAVENADTRLRANLFSPGATRTEMYRTAWPQTDPATLADPAEVADKIVAACLPSVTHTGKLFDFRSDRWLSITLPSESA